MPKAVFEDNSFSIPDDYFRAQSLPDDPPNSIVFEKDTDAAANILMLFFIDKAEAMPFGDEKAVIDTLHDLLSDEQGLIEVKSGTASSGTPFIYSVVKAHRQPSGMQYILTLQLDLGAEVLNLQGYFTEENVTGERDAAIWEYAMREKIISTEDQSNWFADPYDPGFQRGILMNLSERAQFDQAFPEHPLSELRRLVRFFTSEN